MTHSYVWHDPFIRVTWLIHMCDMTHSYVWHDSFICVTRPIHTCDMTHSYVWLDPFIRVTWPIHTYYMTHSYMHVCDTPSEERLLGNLRGITNLVICDMTYSYMWYDSLYLAWLIHTYMWHSLRGAFTRQSTGYPETTGLNLLHKTKFQRFLCGQSNFLNSKFQIREFCANWMEWGEVLER